MCFNNETETSLLEIRVWIWTFHIEGTLANIPEKISVHIFKKKKQYGETTYTTVKHQVDKIMYLYVLLDLALSIYNSVK